MIVIVAKSVVKPGEVDAFKALAAPLIRESRKESGCISYTLYQDTENPNVLTFIEHWEDKAAIDRHNDSSHFKTIVPQLGELREADTQVNLYEALSL